MENSESEESKMRTKDIPFHNLAERQLLLIAQKQQNYYLKLIKNGLLDTK